MGTHKHNDFVLGSQLDLTNICTHKYTYTCLNKIITSLVLNLEMITCLAWNTLFWTSWLVNPYLKHFQKVENEATSTYLLLLCSEFLLQKIKVKKWLGSVKIQSIPMLYDIHPLIQLFLFILTFPRDNDRSIHLFLCELLRYFYQI